MKKNYFLFLALLPLVFFFTGCGDEFGSKSLRSYIHIMFPDNNNQPEKVESIHFSSGEVYSLTKLSTANDHYKDRFADMRRMFSGSKFMTNYDAAEEKPAIHIWIMDEQPESRREYAREYNFRLTDSAGNSENVKLTITIPYLDDGAYSGFDLELTTNSYGKIPVFFAYWFTRSI